MSDPPRYVWLAFLECAMETIRRELLRLAVEEHWSPEHAEHVMAYVEPQLPEFLTGTFLDWADNHDGDWPPQDEIYDHICSTIELAVERRWVDDGREWN